MKKFYLSGQNNFGNRGCEALVRSTLQLLKAEFGEVEVLVPSYRPDLDLRQWPDAIQAGCRFVRAMPYPTTLKVWGKIRKYYPNIKNIYIPDFSIPSDIETDIRSCDALLVIGGDNITLDYGLESLIWHIRFAQHAQRLGKKVMVWGASIGPFNTEPTAEKFVADFLKSTLSVTVRETISEQYLKAIGVTDNVALVADGAFVMTPEPVDISAYWPSKGNTVLGFNISPLIQKFRPAGEHKEVLQKEVVAFIKHTLDSSDTSIVLIPHVDPLDGVENNSDTHYMMEILRMCGDYGSRLTIVPNTLNAAELKYVLSQCTYFIGARTHATIGALSCLVPTISIAYSIKAKGLNRDLFGNEDCVLETPSVSTSTLSKYYQYLVTNRESIVCLLTGRIPLWRTKASISASRLSQVVGK
ncbi:WcaK Polysaccharide pyruvyl transferase family protein [Comamonadaceae bacterium]